MQAAGPILLRGHHGRGGVGPTWSEGSSRRPGEVEEQGRGGSAHWPTPLDMTLPLELSSKTMKSPETLSEGGEENPEGELLNSIRGFHEVGRTS